ncbi:WXG100 family type VII secretion target, partial [Nocardia sp. R6R-6]|uniref:WXG100 family type VII secretion target n=1 Tax=Nocardia sp. R6R-6 TaxID=3459303 RepID=UPI00403E1916
REIGQYVYGIADALRSALDSAARDVDTLLDSSWTGDAANEFTEGWNDIQDGGGRMISALTERAEKLGVTAATYQTHDENRADVLHGSSLDLP